MRLETSRLVVRRFRESDLADFLAYQSLPAVRRFQRGTAMTDEAAARYLAEQATLPEAAPGRWHGYAVEAEGRVVGDVGAFLQGAGDEADVGFQLAPSAQGRGLATEAARALVGHLFGARALRRLTAGCHPENAASFRLLERLGMRRVAASEAGLAYELWASP